MGRRTGTYPSIEQPFFARMVHALDVTPVELAKMIGVRPASIRATMSLPKHVMPDVHDSEVLWAVAKIVDEQLGMLLAIRQELNKLSQPLRVERATRHAAQLERTKRRMPRRTAT